MFLTESEATREREKKKEDKVELQAADQSLGPAPSRHAVISGFPLAQTVKTWQSGTTANTDLLLWPLIPSDLRSTFELNCKNKISIW